MHIFEAISLGCADRKSHPCALGEQERHELERLMRSQGEPAIHVACARAILAVAQGEGFSSAAHVAGRRSGDGMAKLVARCHVLGLAAIAGRPLPGRAYLQ